MFTVCLILRQWICRLRLSVADCLLCFPSTCVNVFPKIALVFPQESVLKSDSNLISCGNFEGQHLSPSKYSWFPFPASSQSIFSSFPQTSAVLVPVGCLSLQTSVFSIDCLKSLSFISRVSPSDSPYSLLWVSPQLSPSHPPVPSKHRLSVPLQTLRCSLSVFWRIPLPQRECGSRSWAFGLWSLSLWSGSSREEDRMSLCRGITCGRLLIVGRQQWTPCSWISIRSRCTSKKFIIKSTN